MTDIIPTGLAHDRLPVRKITIGDLKTGMTYAVGQRVVGSSVICNIIFNEQYWVLYREKTWDILIKEDDSIYVWKKHIGGKESVTLEYDVQKTKNAL
mgnify:CR=1 FL=1